MSSYSYSQLYNLYRSRHYKSTNGLEESVTRESVTAKYTSVTHLPAQKSVRFGGATCDDGEMRTLPKLQLTARQERSGFVLTQELPPLGRDDSLKVVEEELVSVRAQRHLLESGGRGGPGFRTPHNSIKRPSPDSPKFISQPAFSRLQSPHKNVPSERNWVLSDRGPSLPSSRLNASNITVIDLTGPAPPPSSFRHPPSQPSATLSHQRLTNGSLGLTKSNSIGDSLEYTGGREEEIQLSKIPLRRKDVFQLFADPPSPHGDSCCHCGDAEAGVQTISVVVGHGNGSDDLHSPSSESTVSPATAGRTDHPQSTGRTNHPQSAGRTDHSQSAGRTDHPQSARPVTQAASSEPRPPARRLTGSNSIDGQPTPGGFRGRSATTTDGRSIHQPGHYSIDGPRQLTGRESNSTESDHSGVRRSTDGPRPPLDRRNRSLDQPEVKEGRGQVASLSRSTQPLRRPATVTKVRDEWVTGKPTASESGVQFLLRAPFADPQSPYLPALSPVISPGRGSPHPPTGRASPHLPTGRTSPQHRPTGRTSPHPPTGPHPPPLTHPSDWSPDTRRSSLALTEASQRSSVASSDELYKSCPDLRKDQKVTVPPTYSVRSRKAIRRPTFKVVSMEDWGLDDILGWLQHLGMEDLAYLLVGYEITGRDVLQWDRETLTDLGISEPGTQDRLLEEIRRANRPPSRPHSRGKRRDKKHRALFNVIRDSFYDEIFAVKAHMGARDLTVGEGSHGGLLVHRVHADLPLLPGDCLIEIDGLSLAGAGAIALSQQLMSKGPGEASALVVVRRRRTVSTPTLLTPPESHSPNASSLSPNTSSLSPNASSLSPNASSLSPTAHPHAPTHAHSTATHSHSRRSPSPLPPASPTYSDDLRPYSYETMTRGLPPLPSSLPPEDDFGVLHF